MANRRSPKNSVLRNVPIFDCFSPAVFDVSCDSSLCSSKSSERSFNFVRVLLNSFWILKHENNF